MYHLLYLMLLGSATALILFFATWIVQLRLKNASIVDAVWALSFPVITVIYFLVDGTGDVRQLLLVFAVSIWGLRLTIYLLGRTLRHGEDSRYTALRRSWGSNQQLLMLRFFIFQAIAASLVSVPFALIMINHEPGFHWTERLGAGLWLIATLGESVADRQLKNFKSDPANRMKICQAGLWNYSRHPNYFFEWLAWVAFCLMAISAPFGYLSFISPAVMLYFLIKVTGIRYTEDQMIATRGDAYRRYQQTTSSFIPLPKKHVV